MNDNNTERPKTDYQRVIRDITELKSKVPKELLEQNSAIGGQIRLQMHVIEQWAIGLCEEIDRGATPGIMDGVVAMTCVALIANYADRCCDTEQHFHRVCAIIAEYAKNGMPRENEVVTGTITDSEERLPTN